MEQSFGQLTGGGKCAVHIQVRSQLKLCAAACAVKFRALKSVQWSFNAVCAQFQSSTNAGKIVLNNRITNQRRTKNSNTKLVLLHMSDLQEVLSLRDWLQWKICTARIVQNFNSDNGVQWCTKVWGNGAAVFKRDQAVAGGTACKEGVILYSLINGVQQPNNAMYEHTPAWIQKVNPKKELFSLIICP